MFRFLYFRDIWVLRDPTFPAEKKNIGKSLGRGKLNTCATFQGPSLKNGVDIWTFCAVKRKNHGLAS